MENDLQSHIDDEAKSARHVTNDDLVCNDCLLAFEDVSGSCAVYPIKPANVLNGGECKEKKM